MSSSSGPAGGPCHPDSFVLQDAGLVRLTVQGTFGGRVVFLLGVWTAGMQLGWVGLITTGSLKVGWRVYSGSRKASGMKGEKSFLGVGPCKVWGRGGQNC